MKFTTTKSRLAVALSMVVALSLGGCLKPPPNVPNPVILPNPNDNVVKIEIEAVYLTKVGPQLVSEQLKQVTLNAVNGNIPPEPLFMDDNRPSTDWKTGQIPTIPGKPATIILSQAPGDGKGIIAGSIVVESLANSIEPSGKAITINCRFKVRLSPLTGGDGQFHEDTRSFHTGTGKKVTCIIAYQFAIPI